MNAFLRAHRVLKVDRELVQRESSPCWAVCVEYMEGAVAGGPGGRPAHRNEDMKVDYKAVLSEGQQPQPKPGSNLAGLPNGI